MSSSDPIFRDSPPTLTYAQPLFLEEQRSADVFPRLSLFVVTAAVGMVIAVGWLVFVARGRAMAIIPALGILAIVFVPTAVMLRQSVGTTIVEPAVVQLRLRIVGLTVWRRTIPPGEIRDVRREDHPGTISLLKFGIGDTFFMSRRDSVRLLLTKYRTIVVGSRRPDELISAIRAAIDAIAAQ